MGASLTSDSLKEDHMTSVAAHPRTEQAEPAELGRAPTRVLVVDDHPAVRAGLRDLLADRAEFEVVGAAASAEEALGVAEHTSVDVAVVDYQLGGRSGLWLSRKLKRLTHPPAVLIYSAYADGVLTAAAVVAEADGILGKGGLGSELCAQIRRIARGHSCLPPMPPWLGDAIRNRFGHEEQAIFGMLLAGIDPDQIAETLGLSPTGLESQLGAMLRKLEDPRVGRNAERHAA
jgi:DNA-binding NarL/FixJ family response regulator